jgi:sulfur carrier protein
MPFSRTGNAVEMTDRPAITITLNGSSHPLPAAMTLTQFLDHLGVADKPVVVELDELAVFPRDYGLLEVRDGSRVELVTLAAGG